MFGAYMHMYIIQGKNPTQFSSESSLDVPWLLSSGISQWEIMWRAHISWPLTGSRSGRCCWLHLTDQEKRWNFHDTYLVKQRAQRLKKRTDSKIKCKILVLQETYNLVRMMRQITIKLFLSTAGFLNLGTTDILGYIIIYCERLSCTW